MKDFPYTAADFVEPFVPPFNEGRYPYTYACDFIRSHIHSICEKLGMGYWPVDSRAEASEFMKFLNDGDGNYRHIAIIFADAYCLEHGIKVPKIIGYQVNLIGTDLAVGHLFATFAGAKTWTEVNPPKTGFFDIETIYAK